MPDNDNNVQQTREQLASDQFKVLILEDSRTDARLMQRELQSRWDNIICKIVSSEAGYLASLHDREWDLILSDYKMPEYCGLLAQEQLRKTGKNTPFVLISGFLDEDVVLKAINLGVRDYLPKDNLERLVPLVERIMLEKKYQWREAEIRQQQSFLIELLELLNSRYDVKQIYQEIVEWIREFGKFRTTGIRLREMGRLPFKAITGLQSADLSTEDKKIHAGIREELISDMFISILEQGGDEKCWLNDLSKYENVIMTNQVLSTEEKMWILLNYQSVAILPFHQDGELTGMLQLVGGEKNKFTRDQVTFYQKVCNVIEIANNRCVMEQTLWEQGEMIRRVIEHSTNVFYIMTPDYKLNYISEQIEKLLGYSSAEMLNSWVDKLTDNPINKEGMERSSEILELGGYNEPFKLEFLSKSGESVLVEINQTPMRENGRIVEIVGTLTDLSNLKRSEIALLEKDRQYRNLVSKAKVGVALDDEAGNLVYMNETFAELFGYSRKELNNVSFSRLIYEEDIPKMMSYHQKHLEGKGEDERYELRGVRKDGTLNYNEVNVDIIRNKNDEIQGTRIYLWDITDRKRNEILLNTIYQIAQSTRRTESTSELFEDIRLLLSDVMDTTNIFIALYNSRTDELTIPLSADTEDEIQRYPAGKTLSKYVIKKGKAMLLYEEDMDELTAAGVIDLVGKPSKVWLGAPLVYKTEISGVIVVQSYDNRDLYTQRDLEVLEFVSEEIAAALNRKQMDERLKMTVKKLRESKKNLMVEVKRKVNELREKDIELEQRSRQAEIGVMISRLGHNWRQPLNAISTIVQSIKDAIAFDDLTEEMLDEKVRICMETMKLLSEQIDKVRFYYKGNEQYKDFDVKPVLEELVETNQNRFENSSIDLILEPCDPYILYGGPNEFHQALNYVLTNALEILIDRKIKDPWVKVKQEICEGELKISIKDNGGGVPEDLVNKIFELYTSTKKKLNNTGIGLNLAKLIVEQHMNGRLYLVNHKEGAEFVFRFKRSGSD